jgi:hypothetical protein
MLSHAPSSNFVLLARRPGLKKIPLNRQQLLGEPESLICTSRTPLEVSLPKEIVSLFQGINCLLFLKRLKKSHNKAKTIKQRVVIVNRG